MATKRHIPSPPRFHWGADVPLRGIRRFARLERDQPTKALLALIPAEPPLPEEEILAQLARLDKEQPLQEFVHEVFKEVGG
jgi:hypothetical protein